MPRFELIASVKHGESSTIEILSYWSTGSSIPDDRLVKYAKYIPDLLDKRLYALYAEDGPAIILNGQMVVGMSRLDILIADTLGAAALHAAGLDWKSKRTSFTVANVLNHLLEVLEAKEPIQ